MRRPTIYAAAVAALVVGIIPVQPPAAADWSGIEHWSSATVSRLTMRDGRGTLTVRLTVRSADWSGLAIRVSDAYDGPTAFDLPGAAFRCERRELGVLLYECGQFTSVDPPASMPVGTYSVRIPLTGTSTFPAAPADGAVTLWNQPEEGGGFIDYFPVFDTSREGPRLDSTAETKVARLRPGPVVPGVTATLSTEVVAAPQERVERLEYGVGATPWRVVGSNAASLGLQCYLLDPGTPAGRLRCKPAPGSTSFPRGTYQLTTRLTAHGPFNRTQEPESMRSDVHLVAHGLDPLKVDSVRWRYE